MTTAAAAFEAVFFGDESAYKITDEAICAKIRATYYDFYYGKICSKNERLTYADKGVRDAMVRYAYDGKSEFLWTICHQSKFAGLPTSDNGLISMLIDNKNIIVINTINPYAKIDAATVSREPKLYETVLYGKIFKGDGGAWSFMLYDILLNTGLYTFSKKQWSCSSSCVSRKTAKWRMQLLRKWYFDFIKPGGKIKLAEYFECDRIQEMCRDCDSSAIGLVFVPTINANYCAKTYVFNDTFDAHKHELDFKPEDPLGSPRNGDIKKLMLRRGDMEYKYCLYGKGDKFVGYAYIRDQVHAKEMEAVVDHVCECTYDARHKKWRVV